LVSTYALLNVAVLKLQMVRLCRSIIYGEVVLPLIRLHLQSFHYGWHLT
jgi:hypothetical protein